MYYLPIGGVQRKILFMSKIGLLHTIMAPCTIWLQCVYLAHAFYFTSFLTCLSTVTIEQQLPGMQPHSLTVPNLYLLNALISHQQPHVLSELC